MRPEVVIVNVVNSINIGSNLGKTGSRRGNEYGFIVVGVAHGSVNLVTQAIIQREPGLDLPVILSVEAH